MRKLLLLITIFVTSFVGATSVSDIELSELVKTSDHIIIGQIIKVDMIDEDGRQITDPEARTGPGGPNEIRLHIEVVENGIVKTTGDKELAKLTIPLWKMWHYSLGSWKGVEMETAIFMLKGEKYERAYPGHFLRDESDLPEIKRLLSELKTQNKK